jgi:hypothetical protein
MFVATFLKIPKFFYFFSSRNSDCSPQFLAHKVFFHFTKISSKFHQQEHHYFSSFSFTAEISAAWQQRIPCMLQPPKVTQDCAKRKVNKTKGRKEREIQRLVRKCFHNSRGGQQYMNTQGQGQTETQARAEG